MRCSRRDWSEVFLTNAFVPHLLGTVLLGSYVPGVVTGLLVIPFTTWLIHRAVVEDYASARGVVAALLMAVVLYLPTLRALLGA
ncbi:MAG TPA: HXXEE domain-containing protein [Vicinamibacteria bacterium]|nr:HXXEE domain-containing protein [Vicinamibacteria bacterium]